MEAELKRNTFMIDLFEKKMKAPKMAAEVAKVAMTKSGSPLRSSQAKSESSGKQVSAEGEKEFYRQFQIELKDACRDNIRDNDGMFVSDLAMKEEWGSPKEIANGIKSCYAYIINDMNPIYFKKSTKTIRYSDHDSVDVIYYNQSKVSSRDTSERSTTFKIKYCWGGKNKVIQTSLNKLLGNWRPIAYTRAEVIPHSPFEVPVTNNEFNLFGRYQHKYDSEFEIDQPLVDMWLNHIRIALCSDVVEYGDYMINWFAHLLQKPHVKTCAVPLLKSKPGAGKNFTFNVFARYVLNPSLTLVVNDLEKIVGRFNSAALGKLFILIDEAMDSGDRKANQKMKNKISEDKQAIEEKFQSIIEVNDFSNYAMSTNHDFNSIVDIGDRRYFCLECSNMYCPDQPGSEAYWAKMIKSLLTNNAGKHIFHYLLRRDISKFNSRNIPKTTYAKSLKLRQSNSVIRFLLHLRRQYIEDETAGHSGNNYYRDEKLHRDYMEWCDSANEKKLGQSAFLNIMKDNGFSRTQYKERQLDNKRVSKWGRKLSLDLLSTQFAEIIIADDVVDTDDSDSVDDDHEEDISRD